MNRKLQCLIAEDEEAGARLMEEFIKGIPYLVHAGSFEDASSALQFMEGHEVDILITDIEMPGMNGLEMVRSLPVPPAVIFTTAYRDFAPEGFDANAIDYLVKPVSFERFKKAIEKARNHLYMQPAPASVPEDFVFVKKESGYLKLSLTDIAYIEANGDYVNIFTLKNTKTILRITMSELEDKLPASMFLRVHKSYIVNIHMVHFVYPSYIELSSRKEIPLSKNYKAEINRMMGLS